MRTSSVLARPGRAGDQAMSAGEERDQDLLVASFWPTITLREFALDPAAALADLLDHSPLVLAARRCGTLVLSNFESVVAGANLVARRADRRSVCHGVDRC